MFRTLMTIYLASKEITAAIMQYGQGAQTADYHVSGANCVNFCPVELSKESLYDVAC